MYHGIQVYVEGRWVTIQTQDRNQAISLHVESIRSVVCPCRRVLVLESGTTIPTDAE